MHIPVTILDNFFENPDAVREFALAQQYFPSEDGRWPGLRTAPLHTINTKFFNHFCRRVLTLFYDEPNPAHHSYVCFQKVPTGSEKGWIHIDDNIITALVYLNLKSNYSSGTSIYKLKNHVSYLDPDHNLVKIDYYKGKCDAKKSAESRELNNSNFDETIKVSNVYNRLLAFDSSMWHAAQDFDTDDEDRITLIAFFDKVNPRGPVKRSIVAR